MNLGDFGKKVNDFADKGLKENIADITKVVVFECMKRIVPWTPIKTGRARSNWLVGTGYIPGWTVESYGVSNAVVVTLSTAWQQLQSHKQGKPVYIVNNLPYIELLNSGHWSKQAPANYVYLAIDAASHAIKANKNIILKGF